MRPTCHRYVVEGWGVGELWVADDRVLAHELPTPTREAPLGDASAPDGIVATNLSRVGNGFVPEAIRLVHRHLSGKRVDYGALRLDLSWCTPFQAELAEALRRVPWGEVVAYGELAALAGRPRAARAAGTFCAENRFSLFVPCHRVIASDGIGGYGSSGVVLKRRLLALEGVSL